jgi:DNA-binding NarL/FixJ family response regulator
MINLILIEDDLKIQDALKTYFDYQPDFDMLEMYTSAEDFEKSTKLTNTPDVVILDINLPKKSGIELIGHIKKLYPETHLLMLSINNDNESVFKSLQAGADGYLWKATPLDKIKEAITDLNLGGSPITPTIARKIVDYFNTQKNITESLTEREQIVVEAIVDGLSYKLIADKMFISLDTVRKHIKNIYRKLHINSKGELIAKYHHR